MRQECWSHLGLEAIHPYVLRHSGPSGDYLRHCRSLMDIQRKGRWSVESLVRRYTKAARRMSQMSTLTSDMISHFHRCEQEIGEVLLGKRRPLVLRGAAPAAKRIRRR